MLVASWVLVPLIGDTKWTTQSEFYTGSVYNDSYGAHKVLGWLFTGDLFDSGRFPIVSLLFALGVGVCAVQARRDIRARALLGVFGFSAWCSSSDARRSGGAMDVLPGIQDIQIHRFVMGVHLAGILIAGVGLGWLLRLAFTLVGRLSTPAPGPPRRSLGGGRLPFSCWRRRGRSVGTTTRRARRSSAGSRWPMRPTAATSSGSSRS